MKCLVILFTLITYTYCASDLSFAQWQIKYKVRFQNLKERKIRENIFKRTKIEIIAHNSDPGKTYEEDLNEYSHLTHDEFVATKCGTKLPERLLANPEVTDSSLDFIKAKAAGDVYPFGNYTSGNAPSSVDFSYLMSPIQSQMNCSACWAFAVMAQLEGMLKIKDSAFNSVLSPQFLIDCNTGQLGCAGGWPTDAFLWLRSRFGGKNMAPTDLDYPYKAFVDACKRNISTVSLGITQAIENYFAGNETIMQAQVANVGPVIAAIFASSSFQSYKSGVLFDSKCPSGNSCSRFNHAVTVVGYGTDPTLGDYWLVKNSWGTNWGENGYIRMARNKNNNCNIACYIMYSQ